MDDYSASFLPTATATNSAATAYNVNFEAQEQMGYLQNPHSPNLRPFYPQTPLCPSQITQGYSVASSQYFHPYDHTVQISYGNIFQPINQPVVVRPTYSTHSLEQNAVLYPIPSWQVYKTTSHQKTEEEKRKQKIAREIRIQARQKLRLSYANHDSSSSSETKAPETIESNVEDKSHLYNFQVYNGKMVRELFKKKLQSSDVSSLGRIVIPKKVAEKMLPALNDKEGIQILLKDVNSDKEWKLKFKYWSNNKSRMYVLENAASLVKHYQLQSGDYMTLYEDESKNMYVSMRREERVQAAEPSTSSGEDTYNYIHAPYKSKANDEEEEESLALLIEELKRNEAEGSNSLLNL